MKRIRIFIIILIFIILPINFSYCENAEETLKEQQEEFKIEEFIKNSQKYSGEFFENININEILNNAIKGEVDNSTIAKRIWNLFEKEFSSNLKSIGSIFVIIIICAILKAVSNGLKNNEVSKLIYYVQYILIVTIIMTNFSEILKMIQNTSNNLISFTQILIPLLITLMTYTGNVTVSSVIEPLILSLINVVCNVIQTFIIPLLLIFTSLVIISKISDQIKIEKLAGFFKSGITWFLGIVLTIFFGIVSLEGTLASSVDGITAKTSKAVVSSTVPVVGKILGDVVDTVLGCGLVLKNAVGIVGVIIVIGICILPIIKLIILAVSYKVVSVLTQSITDSRISGLLDDIGDVFKIFLGIICSISFMIIIGIALTIKISNGSMMYR